MDQLGHIPPQNPIECLIPMLIFFSAFYLKAYLRHTEPFRKKPDGSHVTSLFLGKNKQHGPVCAETIYSWVRKVLCIAKTHVSGFSLGAATLVAGVSLVSILQASDWAEFLCQLDTIFPPTSLLQIGTRIL